MTIFSDSHCRKRPRLVSTFPLYFNTYARLAKARVYTTFGVCCAKIMGLSSVISRLFHFLFYSGLHNWADFVGFVI